MDVTIRPAKIEELPAVLALYAQPALDGDSVLPLREAEVIFERMQRYPDYHVYVAETDGQVVGTLALLIMDNLGHLGAPSGVVEDVAVHPDWQGRGIGKSLLRFAMEYCRRLGCYKLSLSSNRKRRQAHALYESLGFSKHGYSFWVDLKRLPD